ncbi:EamA family transporter [Chitinophaga agrisoli]|uniref:EamA family transporter n=1 Tax=Chitinophaga agrisoli TaxID=2607653 RepID=A0A5B2VTP9_9BACT|nr:DMT family transporter [Chitinophaga agrisoli]KAA2241489.1 EamA family transporter [Chitinophaga agrisoli]
MSVYALLLVIAAAVLHAAWNLITKQVNGKLPFFWLVSVASSVVCLPFFFVQAAHEQLNWTLPVMGLALVSAILHLLYFVLLQTGYRKADLSVVYPVARGAGPLFSVAGAMLLFSERPGLLALTGVCLIIAGVIVMTGLKVTKNARIVAGLQYGLLTGLFIAAYTLWDRTAVVDYHVSPLFITFASMLLPLVPLIPVMARKREEVKREIIQHWKQIIAVAVFQPVSYLLVLIALKTTPVSYVAPARELSIVVGVFFGANLLKEDDARKRIIAAIVILAGIVLLALG